MIPDLIGGIIGLCSIATLGFLFIHADALSNGNIDQPHPEGQNDVHQN